MLRNLRHPLSWYGRRSNYERCFGTVLRSGASVIIVVDSHDCLTMARIIGHEHTILVRVPLVFISDYGTKIHRVNNLLLTLSKSLINTVLIS